MAKNKAWIIEDVHLLTAGAKGAAIAKPEGQKTIMVRNGVPGDVVDVRIVKKKKRFLEGKVVSIKKLLLTELSQIVNISEFAVAANGKI